MKHLILFENYNQDGKLTLFHGSNTTDIFDRFKDNQFFTEEDYLPMTYAYNQGGYIYEVETDKLNPLVLLEVQNRMKNRRGEIGKGGPYISGSDYYILDLFKKLYSSNTVDYIKKHGFGGKIATSIDGDFKPLIEYAKSEGYDSLKFLDESFDTQSHDITYIIFDGSKVKVKHIYDINDEFESNDSSDRIKIK